MNAEHFTTFLEAMGHRVIQTKSAYWYDVARFAYLSFPFHRPIMPSQDEMDVLWRGPLAVVTRYPCPPDAQGVPSYRIICRDKGYDLHCQSGKTRNQTRRGLEACVVRQLEFAFLAQHGLDLHISTLVRQKRRVPSNVQTYWSRYCTAAANVPGFEAWGAFVGDQLAAFSICFIMDGCYNIFIQRSQHELLKYYPNNAVLYEMTKQALARPDVDEVSFGLESLQQEAEEGLIHFKANMGFQKEPIKQRVVFRPMFRPLFLGSTTLISTMTARYPDSEFWRKLNGLVRFAAAQ